MSEEPIRDESDKVLDGVVVSEVGKGVDGSKEQRHFLPPELSQQFPGLDQVTSLADFYAQAGIVLSHLDEQGGVNDSAQLINLLKIVEAIVRKHCPEAVIADVSGNVSALVGGIEDLPQLSDDQLDYIARFYDLRAVCSELETRISLALMQAQSSNSGGITDELNRVKVELGKKEEEMKRILAGKDPRFVRRRSLLKRIIVGSSTSSVKMALHAVLFAFLFSFVAKMAVVAGANKYNMHEGMEEAQRINDKNREINKDVLRIMGMFKDVPRVSYEGGMDAFGGGVDDFKNHLQVRLTKFLESAFRTRYSSGEFVSDSKLVGALLGAFVRGEVQEELLVTHADDALMSYLNTLYEEIRLQVSEEDYSASASASERLLEDVTGSQGLDEEGFRDLLKAHPEFEDTTRVDQINQLKDFIDGLKQYLEFRTQLHVSSGIGSSVLLERTLIDPHSPSPGGRLVPTQQELLRLLEMIPDGVLAHIPVARLPRRETETEYGDPRESVREFFREIILGAKGRNGKGYYDNDVTSLTNRVEVGQVSEFAQAHRDLSVKMLERFKNYKAQLQLTLSRFFELAPHLSEEDRVAAEEASKSMISALDDIGLKFAELEKKIDEVEAEADKLDLKTGMDGWRLGVCKACDIIERYLPF